MHKSQKVFVDYFSRAEHAYTDWLARNRTTLLSRRSAANRDALTANHRLQIEPSGEAADYDLSRKLSAIVDNAGVNVLPSVGKTPSPQAKSLHRQTTGPNTVPERTQRVARTQFMDGMEDDFLTGGVAPPGPRQEARPEPPREVHPPLRESSRPPECEQLIFRIGSLRGSRSGHIRDAEQALAEEQALHKKVSKLQGTLQWKRERLAAVEYQLRSLDQMFPPSTPRKPNPGYPGPIPDIVDFALRNELRRQAERLRREIQHIENHMNFIFHEMMQIGRRRQHFEGKILEAETLLSEPERQYRQKCGKLGRPLPEWRERR